VIGVLDHVTKKRRHKVQSFLGFRRLQLTLQISFAEKPGFDHDVRLRPVHPRLQQGLHQEILVGLIESEDRA
jgi:hypothetical protein